MLDFKKGSTIPPMGRCQEKTKKSIRAERILHQAALFPNVVFDQTMSRANSAAVIRDNIQYVFVTRLLNADSDTIVSMTSSFEAESGGREFIEVGGDQVRIIKNSPLAATLSVDKTAVNIYYFEQGKNGIMLQEASQKGREPYFETGLGDFLVSKKIFPHPTSTIAACTTNGKVSV